VRENQQLFDAARPASPDMYLLHSEDTLRLAGVEGEGTDPRNPRNRQSAADALCGAYLMCSDLGLNIAFVWADELSVKSAQSLGARRAHLIAPGTYSLSLCTCRALVAFTEAGGRLIADGLIGYKDPDGNLARENRLLMDKLFGSTLEDILPADDGEAPLSPLGWFYQVVLRPNEAQTKQCFPDGNPAVLQNGTGQGSTIRIATVFFQRYMSRPDASHLRLLEAILGEAYLRSRFCLVEPQSQEIRIRVLWARGDRILILMNRGRDARVAMRFGTPGTVTALDGSEGVKVLSADCTEAAVSEGSVRLLLWTPRH
jgi:hypothetical protein